VTALKKWITISSILIICFCAVVAGAYIKAMEPKKDASQVAFEKAKQEIGLVKMEEFYLYHGTEAYAVVVGQDENGEKKVIWLPDDKNLKAVSMNYSEGKTKEEIEEIATNQLNPEEIISIELGMENNVPLWEVTYLDSTNTYNYDYYDFKTGEWLKYYRSI
jgi:uncharacterized protein YpmB